MVTVTATEPEEAMSVAGIVAVTIAGPTNVVASALPLKFTTAPDAKLVPFTVSVNWGPPCAVLLGESELSIGVGFVPRLIGKSTLGEVPPPPGFVTETLAFPCKAMSAALICAVICVELTKVVAMGASVIPEGVMKLTVAPLTKFVPLMVSAKAGPPEATVVGDREVMDSGGGATLTVLVLLGPDTV